MKTTTTRIGKIARLPKPVRDQLNRRLLNGEPGKKLVAWLNQEEDVVKVLAAEFDGRSVSGQNLSEWKAGGYQDWLRYQETCDHLRSLAERAEDFEKAGNGIGISDHLGSVAAVELTDNFQKLDEITNTTERWLRFQQILHELRQLRTQDHDAKRLQIAMEKAGRGNKAKDVEFRVEIGPEDMPT